MAGVITHMVIAKEMQKLLPEGSIQDMGLFYLGTLAPDAVHAREGYVRAHKKHTHFRDDIMDRDFEKDENFCLYQSRLIEFIQQNKGRKDGLLDLYRGYVVHILTDELFILTLRKEFCETMELQGIGQGDRPFFDYIVTDMNRNDLLLVERYKEINEIKECMELVPIHAVEGYLSEQEMSDSRDWLVCRHFYEKHDLTEPVFISYEEMLEFVHSAAVNIVKKLSEKDSSYQMF